MKTRFIYQNAAAFFIIAALVIAPLQPAFGEEVVEESVSEETPASDSTETPREDDTTEESSSSGTSDSFDAITHETNNDILDTETNTDETVADETEDTTIEDTSLITEEAESVAEDSSTPTSSPDGDPQPEIASTTSSGETIDGTGTTSPLEEFQSTTTNSLATTSIESTTDPATTSDIDTEASGTPEIVTGSAIALANILNLVNTNFVNSEGVIVFDNFFETLFGDFDLRAIYDSLAGFGCSLVACDHDGVTTNIVNDASIQNALLIEALTGRNTIEGGATSSISTGNAYAGLNLINVANTNVIDSNYLLVTMNAFQDVHGDIVFPSLSSFFNSIAGGTSVDALNIVNDASVVNNVNVSAQSGDNTMNGNDQSLTTTGNSNASTNVFNQLNTSLSGGQSVSILFRVHGEWAGEIFGAPPNLGWMEDGQGGIYLFDTSAGSGVSSDSLTVNATNTALIQNDIQVVALTGENAISGAETALISTGNAYAGANIVNVANATVVGRNWILAVINILGDFTGNIAFGRPDLWVGAQVDVPEKVSNDSLLTYKFTVINNGDAPASNVRLKDDYDERYLNIVDASVPYTQEGGDVIWNIGSLSPGMATEITYTARVQGASYGTDITNLISVLERETDNNARDNADTITVTTAHKSQNGEGIRISLSKNPDKAKEETIEAGVIQVERLTASTTLLDDIKEVNQKLVVTNTSDKTIRSVKIHDLLANPGGALITDDVWDLGDVLPYEEITIEYSVTFAPSAERGTYTLRTVVEGSNLREEQIGVNGHIILPEVMFTYLPTLTLPTSTTPLVLGATDTTLEYIEEDASYSILPFVIPTAHAATRIDHGLPMTNIPYRYSTYLFLLAIALSNLYYMVRRTRDGVNDDL
jgi:hypothetical protein